MKILLPILLGIVIAGAVFLLFSGRGEGTGCVQFEDELHALRQRNDSMEAANARLHARITDAHQETDRLTQLLKTNDHAMEQIKDRREQRLRAVADMPADSLVQYFSTYRPTHPNGADPRR